MKKIKLPEWKPSFQLTFTIAGVLEEPMYGPAFWLRLGLCGASLVGDKLSVNIVSETKAEICKKVQDLLASIQLHVVSVEDTVLDE